MKVQIKEEIHYTLCKVDYFMKYRKDAAMEQEKQMTT